MECNIVKFNFDKKDLNDFILKKETVTRTENNGMRITKNFEVCYWKKPEIRNEVIYTDRTFRITGDEVPDVFKNVKVVRAPCVFDYDRNEKHPQTYKLDTALLAFKLGYCDGFYKDGGGLFGSSLGIVQDSEPFIVIDPIQAKNIREWTAKEYAKWLDKIDINDFEYVIEKTTWASSTYIGTLKECTFDDRLKECLESIKRYDKSRETEKDRKPDVESEREVANGLTVEQRAENLAYATWYEIDIRTTWGRDFTDHLTFRSKDECEKLIKRLNDAWKFYNNKATFTWTIVNYKFYDFLRDSIVNGEMQM